MLISFKIKNFLSIKDEVELSLDSTSSKSNSQNIFKVGEYNLLKSCVIYGPNACGKTNIIRAFLFVWTLVKHSANISSDFRLSNAPFNLRKFKLDEEMHEMPSEFEINFIKDDIEYIYGFSCDETKVFREFLKYKPLGKKFKRLFARDEDRFEFNSDKDEQNQIVRFTNPNALYLSKSVQFNYKKVNPVHEFIVNELIINYTPIWRDYTIRRVSKDIKFKNKVIDILKRADFGGITNLEINKQLRPFKDIEFKIEGKASSFREMDNEEEFYEVKTTHTTKSGKTEHFDMYKEESGGTHKLFSMLGFIFDVFETGKVLIIDELELNLHPRITHFLVKLFSSKYNKKNGQLIFTTHDTTLLKDKELFRRDQVYICSKKPNEQTELDNFVDFKLREDINFEKAYLEGRVGGLPFIDETFFDENDKEE